MRASWTKADDHIKAVLRARARRRTTAPSIESQSIWGDEATTAALVAELGADAIEPLKALIVADLPQSKTRAHIRSRAFWYLGTLDARAAPTLVELLFHSEDAGIRHGAAATLRGIEDKSAVEPLIQRARTDAVASARASAATALAEIADERAVALLMQAVQQDAETSVGLTAAEAPARPDADIVALGADAIEPLKALIVADLPQGMTRVHIRSRAFWYLGMLGARATPTLVDYLSHSDAGIRGGAAATLGRIGDTSAVEPLMQRVRTDAVASVRTVAATALAKIAGERAVAPLMQAVQQDVEALVRLAAAEALVHLQAVEAIPTFIDRLLRNDTPYLSLELLKFGTPAASPLMDILTDRSHEPDLRSWAAYGLGVIGDPQAIDVLIAAVTAPDEHEEVRWSALSALHTWVSVPRIGSVLRMIATDEGALPRLRAGAINLLSDAGATDLIPLARSWLADATAPTILRRAGLYALTRLDVDDSRALIVAHLSIENDERTRAEIERALARHAPPTEGHS